MKLNSIELSFLRRQNHPAYEECRTAWKSACGKEESHHLQDHLFVSSFLMTLAYRPDLLKYNSPVETDSI